ncbi:hypothetical protein VNO77_20698 [Canavalia gladiata]|uniref:Uncharacterized protein n=1 Tax=Canavalia gladiata TaxID=3824 RepID=A0AAN9QLN0_CANGL
MASHQSFPVISLNYCVTNRINLQINRDKGIIFDINGNAVFKMKYASFSLHKRRVLYDVQENPIVTLYNKNMTLHDRCRVFRGESNDRSELLFSVKKSSSNKDSKLIKLDVFLAGNKKESVRDFRVIVYSGKSTCNVYAGESPTIVATMKNNGDFNVNVHPNVDHAFIVALFMIIDKMKDCGTSSNLTMNMGTKLGGEIAARVVETMLAGAIVQGGEGGGEEQEQEQEEGGGEEEQEEGGGEEQEQEEGGGEEEQEEGGGEEQEQEQEEGGGEEEQEEGGGEEEQEEGGEEEWELY